MKPLTNFVNLIELRVFRMRDSFQRTIWETVWRTQAAGRRMRVLELRMAKAPILRSGPKKGGWQTEWIKGDYVRGFLERKEGETLEYKLVLPTCEARELTD
jgi:hypothetical protein